MFILPLVSLGQTNIYHPFPDSNAMWTDRIYDPNCNLTWECSINQYIMTGDTVIDGNSYKKLTKSGYLIDQNYQYTFYTEYAGAIRQEIANKKVYYYPPIFYPQTDTLLYDFDLTEGDPIPLSYLYPYNFCDAVVDIIDSVAVGGSYRKRFHISTTNPPSWGQTWLIEGIGTTQGLFGGFCDTFEGSQDLTCFIQDDSITYPTPANLDCDLITSISNTVDAVFSLQTYPNPFTENLILEVPFLMKETIVKILNLKGQELIKRQIIEKTTRIEVSDLPKGVFVVQLTNEKYSIIKKVIKE